MTSVQQLDQVWQGHTIVISAPKVKFTQSGERLRLLDVLGLSEENLGSDGFKRVAPAHSVGDLCHAVDGFGIGVRNRSIEVVEDFWTPVIDCSDDLKEGITRSDSCVLIWFSPASGLASRARGRGIGDTLSSRRCSGAAA